MKIPKKIWNWNKVTNVVVLEDPAQGDIFIAPDTYGPAGAEEKTNIDYPNLRTSMWDEILPYKGMHVRQIEDPESLVESFDGDCVIASKKPAGAGVRLMLQDGPDGCWDGNQGWYHEKERRLISTWESVPFLARENGPAYDESMFASVRLLN